ncbi:MAG: DUF3999 domain-containing protein [Acidobacteria bacterium]|nr:DUF3999 domain-containing protein [Acidobacteriota bacterium]
MTIIHAKNGRLAWHQLGGLYFLSACAICLLTIVPEGLAQSTTPSNKINQSEWKKWRDILSSGKQSGADYALVELDPKVFDSSNENLSDLRIVDQDGNTSPYLILETERNARLKRLPANVDDQGVSGQSSELIVDLGYRLVPSSRIEFQPAISNFHRRFEIARSNDRKNWLPLGEGELVDVNIGRTKRQQLHLNYDEVFARYLRIRVYNQDDQPFILAEARVFGHPRKLLFRVEPGKSYRLFYGNQRETAPRYDLEQLLPYVKIETLPVMRLDEEHENRPEAVSQLPDEPDEEGHPGWLWATLTLAALVIGILIYRLARMTVV